MVPTTTSPGAAAESAAQRERRRRILSATTRLAAHGGYDAVQMRAVADQADVALGTLYRYFPSKIHLLVDTLAVRMEWLADSLADDATELRDASVVDKTLQLMRRGMEIVQREPRLAEALTRGYVFADADSCSAVHRVGALATRILASPMQVQLVGSSGPGSTPPDSLTEHQTAVAEALTDVWLATMTAWITGRLSAAESGLRLERATVLMLRD